MKKIVNIIILFISIDCIGQSELEKKVLSEINAYRTIHKLPLAKWDSIAYNAAHYHTKWMVKAKIVSHFETIDVPDFIEIYEPLDRGKKFGLKNNTFPSEICNKARVSGKNPFIEKRASNDEIAKNIINGFKASPPHNEALLQKINEGSKLWVGISCIIVDDAVYTTVYFIEELE